jgi:hypothetical protein
MVDFWGILYCGDAHRNVLGGNQSEGYDFLEYNCILIYITDLVPFFVKTP